MIVSTASMISLYITLLISLVIPFVVAVILMLKDKNMMLAVLAGVLSFFLAQIAIRLPTLQVVSEYTAFNSLAINSTFLYSFLLGFSVALLETMSRVIIFYITQKKLNYQFALGAGFGHGAIEFIYLVAITYINNLILAITLNTQGIAGLSEAMMGNLTSAQYIASVITRTEPVVYILAGVERIFTIVLQMALSLIICYGFLTKKFLSCVLIVVISHTFIDTLTLILSIKGINILLVEFMIFLMAVVSFLIIVKLKKLFPNDKIFLNKII